MDELGFYVPSTVFQSFRDDTLEWSVACICVWNDPSHDKTSKMACVPSKDSDQPGHPPSQSLRCLHEESLGAELPIEGTAKTLAQSDLSLRWAHSHFVGFVVTRSKLADLKRVTFNKEILCKCEISRYLSFT